MFPSKNVNPSFDPSLIAKYLDPNLVVVLDANERDEALKVLVDLLDAKGKLKNREVFYNAILEREKIVSTGIGMAVAVPHAKLAGYETFFIAIGVHRKGIEWDSIDGINVRLVFMIGGPDDKQTEYLQLLSRLTTVIKDEEKRKKMLQFTTGEEMIALLGGA